MALHPAVGVSQLCCLLLELLLQFSVNMAEVSQLLQGHHNKEDMRGMQLNPKLFLTILETTSSALLSTHRKWLHMTDHVYSKDRLGSVVLRFCSLSGMHSDWTVVFLHLYVLA